MPVAQDDAEALREAHDARPPRGHPHGGIAVPAGQWRPFRPPSLLRLRYPEAS